MDSCVLMCLKPIPLLPPFCSYSTMVGLSLFLFEDSRASSLRKSAKDSMITTRKILCCRGEGGGKEGEGEGEGEGGGRERGRGREREGEGKRERGKGMGRGRGDLKPMIFRLFIDL